MIIAQTIHKMRTMKFYDMAEKLKEMSGSALYQGLSPEEIISLLIDAEYTGRENRKRSRLLKLAQMKYQSHIEEIDYHSVRGLDKSVMTELINMRWVENYQNVLIHGPTGIGKSFIACAIGMKSCEHGVSVFYIRMPKLMNEINQSRGTGNYLGYLKKLSRYRVLIMDDFGLSQLNKKESVDFLDVIEDRYQTSSVVISSQLPFEHWHQIFSDETIADAICDRLFHNTYKIKMKGESMRKPIQNKSTERKEIEKNS